MRLGAVLHAAVGVEQASRQRPAGGERRRERGGGEAGVEMPVERVADHAPRPGVEHDGEIDEARR